MDIFETINKRIKESREIRAKTKPLQLTTTEYKMLLDAKIKSYNSPIKTGDTYKSKQIEVIKDENITVPLNSSNAPYQLRHNLFILEELDRKLND